MTTPTVTELARALEPTTTDVFIDDPVRLVVPDSGGTHMTHGAGHCRQQHLHTTTTPTPAHSASDQNNRFFYRGPKYLSATAKVVA